MKNRCKHTVTESLVWRVGGGDIKRWFGAASFETPDAIHCTRCGAWLPLGVANDADVEHEIAAARLIAGYVTANDTDDTLADPIAREVLDWQLEESPPLSDAAVQCDALYVVIVEHIDRDKVEA